MRKRNICKNKYCSDFPYPDGFCESHYKEHRELQKRKDNGLTLLRDGTVYGERIEDEQLKGEFIKLTGYWSDVCFSCNNQRDAGCIPNEEAEYAVSWCRGLAEIIFYEELYHRGHEEGQLDTGLMRQHLWERFENLEKGLQSNGIPRSKDT